MTTEKTGHSNERVFSDLERLKGKREDPADQDGYDIETETGYGTSGNGTIRVNALSAASEATVTTLLGQPPGHYVPGTSWRYWKTMFENYLDIRNVTEDKAKVQLMINRIGGAAYSTIEGLLYPEEPRKKSYDQLVSLLETHFTPKLLILGERFKLLSMTQKEEQSLADFYAAISQAARTCDLKTGEDFRDALITMSFLKGIRSEETRVRLLEKEGVKSSELLATAQTFEIAHAHGLQTHARVEAHKVNKQRKSSADRRTCFRCGKQGHIARYCKAENPVHRVEYNEDSDDEDYGYENNGVYKLQSVKHSKNPPFMVEVIVNGQTVKFEADTGSPHTIITEKIWKSLGRPRIERSSIKLHGYSGEEISLRGVCKLHAQFQKKTTIMDVLISRNTAKNIPQLCGRDMMAALEMDRVPFCQMSFVVGTKESTEETCQTSVFPKNQC